MKSKIFNFLIYGFGQSINILGPLLIVPHIITTCGFEGLGKVGIAFSLSLLLCCFIDYSSAIIGTKDISIHRENQTTLGTIVADFLGAKFIITVIAILGLLIAINLIPFLSENKTLYYGLIPLLIAQLFHPNWILQGVEKFKVIAVINLLSKGLYLSLVFLLVTKETDYIWVNFYLGISNLIFFFASIVYIILKLGIRFNSIDLKKSFSLIQRDFSICISEFCLAIYQFFPIILVGYILGNASAGIFKVIEQIISVFRTYIFMFFNFSYPTVCFDFEKTKRKGLKTWIVYHLINVIIILFGSIFIYILKDYVLTFFKVSPENLEEVNYYLKFALIVPIILAISQGLRQLMFVLELMKPYTLIIYASTLINIIFMVYLADKMGIFGVILAMIIVEIIVCSLYIFFTKKQIKHTVLP